jgi:threonine/homoserine/homoserine lactone efflux protein
MIFIRALVFGVTLAIAIGPIALLIIRYAATGGLRVGLASACGAGLADLTYATIALSMGTAIAPLLRVHTTQVPRVAAITLIAFGLWLIWTAIQSHPPTSGTTTTPKGSRWGLAPLFTTYALTVANPLTVIAFLAFLGQLPLDASTATRAVAALGLFTGSLCIQIMLASCGALLGRLVTVGRGVQLLNVVSGTGIVLFGVVGLFR